MASDRPNAPPPAVLEAVDRVLGQGVHEVEQLEGRETVFGVGDEAVVKCGDRHTLDEWAALSVIGDLGLDPAVAPRLLGGDVEARVLVMERLAPAPSLAGLLLGGDRAAARAGLVAVARALGRLHAATVGAPAHQLELRRASLGPAPSVRHHVVRRLPRLLARVHRWTDEVGMDVPAGLFDDLERVRTAMARPGPFLALVHGDPCPDNNRVYGDRAVLFDFQMAAVDHCLLDGCYFRVPLPSCWCVADLDGAEAEAAYREELAQGLPEVADDACWLPALAEATACWFLLRGITGLGWALRSDEQWGTVTMAQRLVDRSRRFAALAREADVLPALAEAADQVVRVIERTMPDLAPMPAYPALARAGQAVVARPEWWHPAP